MTHFWYRLVYQTTKSNVKKVKFIKTHIKNLAFTFLCALFSCFERKNSPCLKSKEKSERIQFLKVEANSHVHSENFISTTVWDPPSFHQTWSVEIKAIPGAWNLNNKQDLKSHPRWINITPLEVLDRSTCVSEIAQKPFLSPAVTVCVLFVCAFVEFEEERVRENRPWAILKLAQLAFGYFIYY